MPIFLKGISAQFFRGIGNERQYLTPFGEINFFIGPNNSGKSIVLNLISSHLQKILSTGSSELTPSEVHRGDQEGSFLVEIALPIQEAKAWVNKHLEEKHRSNSRIVPQVQKLRDEIFNHFCVQGAIWGTAQRGSFRPSYLQNIDVDSLFSLLENEHQWQRHWSQVTGAQSGDLRRHWIPETISALAPKPFLDIPDCLLIPAKRQLGGRGESFDDLSGKGLIDHLAKLQNPGFLVQHEREEFKKINSFLRVSMSVQN